MKLLEITTTKMPSRNQIIQVGWIIENKPISFDESAALIVEATKTEDTEVLGAIKFGFCIDLDEKVARDLIIRSIMPFPTDLIIRDDKIEFTANGWQIRCILRRWLVMDNIYLQKMGASIVLDMIDNDLVFLVRDILDRINKGEVV